MKCSDEELRQNVHEWVVATIKTGRFADKGRVTRSQLDVRFGFSAAARLRLSKTLDELVERGELSPCEELRSVGRVLRQRRREQEQLRQRVH